MRYLARLLWLLAALVGARPAEADDVVPAAPASRLRAGLEVIALYQVVVPQSRSGTGSWYHAFDLDRAHAWLGGSLGPVEGRVLLEAVRSARQGALMGVAGDSLVFRAREAWGALHPWSWLAVRGGLLPTLLQPAVEVNEGLRALGANPLEADGLLTPADLGASVTGLLPAGYGRLSLAVWNGEGYQGPERNRGKNVEAWLEVHPLAGLAAARPLRLGVGLSIGSAGTGRARTNRYAGLLAWATPRLAVGGAFTWADGVAGDGRERGYVAEGWARARPWAGLLLAVRGARTARDVDVAGDAISRVTAAVGWRFRGALDVWLAGNRTWLGDRARTALPGLDAWAVGLVLALRLDGGWEGAGRPLDEEGETP